jgi:anti-sigma B factor antagonist
MAAQSVVKTELKSSLGIISLAGEFSGTSEDLVLNAYKEVTKGGATKILLRFADDFYINSAGIAVLILMVSQANQENQKLGAVGLSPHFQKIFHLIGLTDYLDIYLTEEEAGRKL